MVIIQRRSATGGMISIGEWSATKRGNQLVGGQGLWLRDNSAPSLPAVFSISDHAYTMERLGKFPIRLSDTLSTLDHVKDLLQRDVWSQPAVVKFDLDAHLMRLKPLDFAPLIRRKMVKLQQEIDWDLLKSCLTHGDPIIDNLMLRQDGSIVITDPIPATPGIPDLLSVDVGRLLQSAVGYEKCLGMWTTRPRTIDPGLIYDHMGLDKNEKKACIYWALVHCHRAMKYVDEQTADAIRITCVSALLDELVWVL
jgi:hypothetical protein